MPILKEKKPSSSKDPRVAAGESHEKEVAFYLRRAFQKNPLFFVINDLRISFEGENAQIDHLVVHPTGFVIIESKSIHGSVSVNEKAEWSRSHNGRWKGMKSPIRQAEMQRDVLKSLLSQHRSDLLGKLLGLQQGFGGRQWHTLCAVSSSANIQRNRIPKDIGDQIVKCEFIGERVKEIGRYSTLRQIFGKEEVKPVFSESELKGICNFLLRNMIAHQDTHDREFVTDVAIEAETEHPASSDTPSAGMTCRKCGSANLTPQSGRFGYFARCLACGGNTPMKQPCPACGGSEAKPHKKGSTYILECSCGHKHPLFY